LGYFACDEKSCADAIIRAHEAYTAGRTSITPSPTWQFLTPRGVAQQFAFALNSMFTGEPAQLPVAAKTYRAADVRDHSLLSPTETP
jgi:hypothetical protein